MKEYYEALKLFHKRMAEMYESCETCRMTEIYNHVIVDQEISELVIKLNDIKRRTGDRRQRVVKAIVF